MGNMGQTKSVRSLVQTDIVLMDTQQIGRRALSRLWEKRHV